MDASVADVVTEPVQVTPRMAVIGLENGISRGTERAKE